MQVSFPDTRERKRKDMAEVSGPYMSPTCPKKGGERFKLLLADT